MITLFFLNVINAQEISSSLKLEFNPTNNNYWWLENNNYGKSILDKELHYKFEFKTSKTTYLLNISNAYQSFDYSIDENILHPISGQLQIGKKIPEEKIYFGEFFIKHDFSNNLFLRAGKYYRDFSLYLNDDLSSGSMLISKNAQPMPKIGLVGEYALLRNKNISFSYGIAHGLFKKNNYYEKAPYLHEKFIYLNLKKKSSILSIGFVHEAMWGGSSPIFGDFPSSFKDFLKIMISADGPKEGSRLDNPDWHINALGNHLGIWDFSYQKVDKNKKMKAYYQHFFEDTSSLRFANGIDGLWGLELENYLHQKTILFEYMDTSNAYLDPPYQSDRYYWNYQYRLGWSYQGNIIGNPYVNANRVDDTSSKEFKELTKLFHIGIKGAIKSTLDYSILASKRININDNINYKISIRKKITNNLNFNLSIMSGSSRGGFSGGMEYIF